MVTVPRLKLVPGEPCIEFCLQNFQQFVDRKDGIIHLITGVNGRDFFVPDQQERIRRIQLQAFVEHFGQYLAAEFGKRGASDLRSVEQAFVGCHADRIEFSVYAHGKPEIFCRILYGFL